MNANASGRTIKILNVFGQMNRGGELRTLDLMRSLDRKRYQLDFVALSGLEGTLDDQIRSLGGEVHYCRLGWAFPRKFRSLLLRERYDVVHSHVHFFSGYLLRLAEQMGISTRIAHFRSTGDDHADGARRRLQRALLRHWIDRHATHILAVGSGTMTAAWGSHWRSDHRCRVVHNGLDVSRFQVSADRDQVRRELGVPVACTLYMHVGRLIEDKNHGRVVSIFAQTLQRNPSARLVLVGGGNRSVENAVRKSIQDLAISSAVTFAGERDDVPRLLQAADLLLFPSRREGLPGVVLEACAAGLPVLGSDLPGICEIADHFPRVCCLPLAAPDACWVQQAEQLLAVHRSNASRPGPSPVESFLASPFSVRQCCHELCRIWDGASRRAQAA